MVNISHNIYRHQVQTLNHGLLELKNYQDLVLLLVNTASHCGFTPQYEGLDILYQKYREQGLFVIGFPCNQFGLQEPGDSSDIQNFCSQHYSVSFPLSEKIKVNGTEAHPLYADLTSSSRGLFMTKKIKWNFTKFLVAPQAQSIKRFSPLTAPQKLESTILSML